MWSVALILACGPVEPQPPGAEPWGAPDHLTLWSEVGAPAASATLRLSPAPAAAPSVSVEGPFAVRPRGLDMFEVVWSGPTSEPALAAGRLVLRGGGRESSVELFAVIADPDLGPADWIEDEHGRRARVDLPSAPNAAGTTSWSDYGVWVVLPPSFTGAAGVNVVTHLHGHHAYVPETVDEQALVPLHALSGRDAALVVPQGPVWAASGDFGQLMTAGGHARLVRDVVSVLVRDGIVDRPVVGAQVLTAHSGGYLATAAIVRQGGLSIAAVHLFDALYGETSTFRDFAAEGILRSNYTTGGGTLDQNEALRGQLTADGLGPGDRDDDDALHAATATVAWSPSAHGSCMRDRRAYARWLAASGLPFGPTAAPELRAVVLGEAGARVTWLEDGGAVPVIEGSDDGQRWAPLPVTAGIVPLRSHLRLRWAGGAVTSDVYAIRDGGPRWLVVDGFDRVLGGSWTASAHPFAADVALALGRPVDTASNEAVVAGDVDLQDYAGVIWLLGDEGLADDTFDADERALIAEHLDAGGQIIVSGAEVGYATDEGWLGSVLGARQVADDAGADALEDGRRFGTAYPEDYPDVLDGERVVWRYTTGGAAAVSDGRAVVVGFPIEGLEGLEGALEELIGALGGGR